ncbi:MAG: ABC transporter ATP-binding protein [Pseudomonadales bacterium]|nr:ABC transporter ATP-binding protein [Pseudomonadales bacterium]
MNTSSIEPVLRISDLHKNYGKFEVIRGLQLEVARSAIHGLVGLNGSGKTTTLECVLGLQTNDGGDITILGRQPQHIHLNEGRVVAIFDTPSLNPNLTVNQTLAHAAMLCGASSKRIDEVTHLLGIEAFKNFKIKNLSLGNKRRASIAQGLIGNPELVLLDEPFNGLDAGGVDDVLQLITALNREQGTTFLLSSHQLPYLEQICSHIAILHQGRIALSGSKADLLNSASALLQVRVSDKEQTRQLATDNGMSWIENSDSDLVSLDIGELNPAEVNSLLVNNGIAVSELIQQRASLEALFRLITNGEAA